MSQIRHDAQIAAGGSFDPHIWKIPFAENAPTPWICSRCHTGRLVPKKITFYDRESADSLAMREEEAWNENWYEGRFSGILECENAFCGDVAAVAGRSAYAAGWDQEGEEFEYSELHPAMIHPAPWIVPLPDALSNRLRQMAIQSFSTYWSDPAATIFRIRIVLGVLLRSPGWLPTTGSIESTVVSGSMGSIDSATAPGERSGSPAVRRTKRLSRLLLLYADAYPDAKEEVHRALGLPGRFPLFSRAREEALLYYGILHRVIQSYGLHKKSPPVP